MIPYAIGAGVLAGIGMLWKTANVAAPTALDFGVLGTHATVSGVPITGLVPVQLGGDTWLVTPDYVGPVGINEAAAMALAAGMQLPSPALVDAIWRQADLKLAPLPRNNIISQAVFDDQVARIKAQIAGRQFTLLGGSFKDVVQVNGHPEIYGWHVDVEHGATVPGVPLLTPATPGPGRIIQPQSGKAHDLPGPIGFKDYSQGVRLVRKA